MFCLLANFNIEYNNLDRVGVLKLIIVCKCSFCAILLVKSATVVIDKSPLYLHIE